MTVPDPLANSRVLPVVFRFFPVPEQPVLLYRGGGLRSAKIKNRCFYFRIIKNVI